MIECFLTGFYHLTASGLPLYLTVVCFAFGAISADLLNKGNKVAKNAND